MSAVMESSADELQAHEYANIFPVLSGDTLAELRDDIADNGLAEPIWLYEGKILDGRNRYRACLDAGIDDIETREFEGDDPLGFVLSLNLHRRHLDSGQRACVAVELERIFAAEAAERKAAAAAESNRRRARIESAEEDRATDPVPQKVAEPAEAREQAARVVGGTNRQYVSDAKKLERENPELFAKVKAGEVPITKVRQEEKARKLDEKKKANAESSKRSVEAMRPRVTEQPAIEFLASLPNESIDLLLTDPPYSTDVDDIRSFVDGWVPRALEKMKPTGRAFICIGAYPREVHAYLAHLLEKAPKWTVDNPLVWTYRNTLGITPKRRYNLNYQFVLHLYREGSRDLDTSVTNEMFSVQDINAPDGRQGDRYHTWQKPDELANRLVRHAAVEGETVVDPFCCTGTFLLAAARHGCVASGCDIDPEALTIARERGCE